MASEKHTKPRDPWERRLIRKHGFPQPLARAYADLRKGLPD
ncbi:hypothetical protein [Tritonibacter mobilis]|nr:hypothetical protein [Tritonibacter mobilis]